MMYHQILAKDKLVISHKERNAFKMAYRALRLQRRIRNLALQALEVHFDPFGASFHAQRDEVCFLGYQHMQLIYGNELHDAALYALDHYYEIKRLEQYRR